MSHRTKKVSARENDSAADSSTSQSKVLLLSFIKKSGWYDVYYHSVHTSHDYKNLSGTRRISGPLSRPWYTVL